MLSNLCALVAGSLHMNLKKNCIQKQRNRKVTLLTVFPNTPPKCM